MMFDAYLVDLLALKEVETDRLTDRLTDKRTIAFLELLSQLKNELTKGEFLIWLAKFEGVLSGKFG